MAVYKGFNTVGKVSPPWSETDISIVKQDLLNHFHTRKGERLMLPNFGSRIHELLFDQFDDLTVNDIRNDVKEIISQDPRVELIDMKVTELINLHGIRVELNLYFKPQDTADHLVVDFEKDIRESF